ncbi:hypothetical protein R84B8_01241 [Treponema sp. R8-4-B8]
MVKKKVEPFPNSDSIHIEPPISSTMFLEIASPSPVPPYLRVVLDSACANDLKSFACCSGLMPIPVSLTETCRVQRSLPIPARRTVRDMEPFSGVNFIAFPSKLVITCAILCSSPIRTRGMLCSICTENL